MAAKRNAREYERDLALTETLWVQGFTLKDISAAVCKDRHYKLSAVTIHNDVSEILSRWRKTLEKDIGELKGAELARINRLENAAWLEWERSRDPAIKRISGSRTGGKDGDSTHEQTIEEEQCGDPRYLERVQWCIEKRCKILGLDAPTKIAPTDAAGTGPCVINVVYEGEPRGDSD